MDPFDSHIPGQSLTADNESPLPFETAPEFTDKDELTKAMFEKMMEPEMIAQISEFLDEGIPIETMTKVILFAGMTEGKINVDMQLLMVEPLIYMILFVAERIGVDPVLSEDEALGELDIEDEIAEMLSMDAEQMEEVKEKISPSLLSKVEESL